MLNRHEKHPNGYCGILHEKVSYLNRILRDVDGLQIVLSSAWRYSFGTVRAVETLLAIHGCDCVGRIHGLTESDEATYGKPLPGFGGRAAWESIGLKLRGQQIHKYVDEHKPAIWVAVDDLPIDAKYLIQTNPDIGLTLTVAEMVIDWLTA